MEKEQQREKILSHPKPLSPNQRRAVLSDRRHIRIIAGAGAGKTETLTRRIVYHLLYEEIDPAAIVAFTFTDKAAQGMKSRIYDRLKDMGRDDLRARSLPGVSGQVAVWSLRQQRVDDENRSNAHATLYEAAAGEDRIRGD